MRAFAVAAAVCALNASSVAHADLRERAAAKLETMGVDRNTIDRIAHSDMVLDLRDRAAALLQAAGLESEVLDRLKQSMVNRARRAVAVGPHAGLFQQLDAKDSFSGLGASFGVSLYVFDTPMRDELAAVVRQTVQDEVIELVRTGQTQVTAREVVDRVVDRMIDNGFTSRPLIPTPLFSAILEGQLTFGDADGFGARLALGYGLWKLTFAASLAVLHVNDTTSFAFGPEVSFRLTPIGQTRTPVIDIFGRYELAARDGIPQTGSLGLRLQFDVL